MIFRQLFDRASSTYTYLIANRLGGEALLIDPVIEKTSLYLRLLSELDLKLVKAVDTHCHADHITALGSLRDQTHCITVMGKESLVDVVSMRVEEGDTIDIEDISLEVMYTPGHTDDSYCFCLPDRIFTGDTLLIRGTGRTDFQNGDPRAAYRSLFGKVLTLSEDTLVYPGHDYRGETVSTIAEERAFNPRLQVSSADEYADIMNNLNLPNPKLMDVAVPANRTIGFHDDDPVIANATLSCADMPVKPDDRNAVLIDLREDSERERDGVIAGSIHAPYASMDSAIKPNGLLRALAEHTDRPLVFYCAFGERSALALKKAKEAGLENICHLGGGVGDWDKTGLPLGTPIMVQRPPNAHVPCHEDPAVTEAILACDMARRAFDREDAIFVDLRGDDERQANGSIPGAVHIDDTAVHDALKPAGLLWSLSDSVGKPVVFYSTSGERSIRTLKAAKDAGFNNSFHLDGGMDAWINADAPVVVVD